MRKRPCCVVQPCVCPFNPAFLSSSLPDDVVRLHPGAARPPLLRPRLRLGPRALLRRRLRRPLPLRQLQPPRGRRLRHRLLRVLRLRAVALRAAGRVRARRLRPRRRRQLQPRLVRPVRVQVHRRYRV